MKKLISILMAAVLVTATFAGCSRTKENINIVYPFSANVNSYDPQVAATGDEYLIIENTFEGLVRLDADGKIVKGAAEKWDISADGLTYTFDIKKGLKWNINTDKDSEGKYKDSRLEMMGKEFNPDITADDFVFGLRRAVMPETDCPLFSSIANIKNATKIRSGKMKPTSLGVTAVDKYTLQIQLEKQDKDFLQELTCAAAMPCNEEFFKATNGRYGLDTKYILFNGQFYLKQILESSYLLKCNDYYKGDNPTKVNELALKILNDENKNDVIKNLESGYYDAAFINGDESNLLSDKDITSLPYIDTTWAFILNTKNEILSNKNIRKAFCLGFTKANDKAKEYLSPATNLIPPSCTIGGNNAIKAIGSTCTKQNVLKSTDIWSKEIAQLENTEIEITVLTDNNMEDSTKQMLSGIQEGIGTSLKNKNGDTIAFSLKVEVVDEDELKSRVSSGDYDIALYPFKADNQSPISYLQGFADENLTGFDTAQLKSSIKNANTGGTLNTIADSIGGAEKAVINSYSVCPMLYETSYYVCAKGVDGIIFHPGTGRVNFVNTVRNE